MISYLYTKIPLFLFAIKKEEKRGEVIIVYNIHFFLLLAYKSNLFFIKQIKNQENIEKQRTFHASADLQSVLTVSYH